MKIYKKIIVTMFIGILFGCCASVGVLASESDVIVKKYEKTETAQGETKQDYVPNQVIVAVSTTATTKEVEDEILSYAEEYRIHGQYNGKYLQKVDMDVIRTKDETDFTMCITIKEGLDLDDTIAALKEKSMVVWCHKNYYAEYATETESGYIVKYEKPETLPGQTIQDYVPNQVIVAVSTTATTKEVEDEILSYAEEYRIHGEYNGKRLQKVDMDVIRTKGETDFTMCITIKEGLDLDDTIAALKDMSMVVWCHKNYYAEYAEQGDVPTPSIAENVTTETVQPVVVKKITYVNVKKITLKAGKKFTVKVKATGKVKFTSSNKKIVKVTQKGVVKAKKKGSAKIIITCGKTSKTIKVKVK